MIKRALSMACILTGLAAAAAASPTPPKTPEPATPRAEGSPPAPDTRAQAEALYETGYADIERAWLEIAAADSLKGLGDDKATDLSKKSRKSARKRFDKAIERLQKAVDLAPDYHEAWNMLGYCYRKTGQLGNAFKVYDTCLKLAPDFGPAHEYRGEAYLMAGDMEKAEAELAWLNEHDTEGAGHLEEAMKKYAQGGAAAVSGTGW